MKWDCLKEHALRCLFDFACSLSSSFYEPSLLRCAVFLFFLFKVWVWYAWHSVIKKKEKEEVGLQKVFTSSYTLFEPCTVVICVLLKLIITNQTKPYWHEWEPDGVHRAENKFLWRENYLSVPNIGLCCWSLTWTDTTPNLDNDLSRPGTVRLSRFKRTLGVMAPYYLACVQGWHEAPRWQRNWGCCWGLARL